MFKFFKIINYFPQSSAKKRNQFCSSENNYVFNNLERIMPNGRGRETNGAIKSKV
jgi:hypothetical protein